MVYIEKDLPVEKLGELAYREAHARKPIYQMHKWWARRSGSVFRMFTLASFIGDEESEDELWRRFYQGSDLKGKVILDPFMGGGTTLVEGLRLGCKVIGVDINPVAWFVTKKEIEAVDLAKLDAAFHRLQSSVGRIIRKYYRTMCPKGHDAEIIYALWVKQVQCAECGESVSLFSGYRISNEKTISTVYCPNCSHVFTIGRQQKLARCPSCQSTFDPDKGVAGRGQYKCPNCGAEETYLDAIKRTRRPLDATLFAIECYCVKCGRLYKSADEADTRMFESARVEFENRKNELLFPRQAIPTDGRSDPRPVNYGYEYFWQLFNERQLLCLSVLLEEMLKIEDENIREFLLLAFSDCLDTNNVFCKYEANYQKISLLFGLNAYHPIERFGENNVWGTKFGRGSFTKCFNKVRRGKVYSSNTYERIHKNGKSTRKVIGEYIGAIVADDFEDLQRVGKNALIKAGDSREMSFIPSESVDAVLTDPPYFDNVMYSEMADFFYVWLRLGLKEHYRYFVPELSGHPNEIVQNDKAGKDIDFFAANLAQVFSECHRVLKSEGHLLFTFHHSKPWAWESMAQVLLDAGFYVSSAPIVRSEGKSGFHSNSGNVKYDACLVCRKRTERAQVCDWEVLKAEISGQSVKWLERIIKSGMAVNKVDVLVIVMGKLLEAYMPDWPLIVCGGGMINIHEAIMDVMPLVEELAGTAHEMAQMGKEYPERPIQLNLLLRERRARYGSAK